jgi:acyl carrier protein
MSDTITATIRDVLTRSARLPVDVHSIAEDADLFQAGMSSHASVSVMLGLEDAFDVEFPDSMLKRSVFESIASIGAALETLAVQAA